jgi:outer membrane protein TolC
MSVLSKPKTVSSGRSQSEDKSPAEAVGKNAFRTNALRFGVPPIMDAPPRHEVEIDTNHPNTLPELIDLAQRNNQTTRIAWEHAKQAALAVGLVEATYLPDLSVEALGGSQGLSLPVPKSMAPKGYINAQTNEFIPVLTLKWLLFDFGQREAKAEAAHYSATAADVSFTGAHQKLIFEVSRAYFALDAVRAQVRVAESALKTAQVLQEAAEAKFEHGLATVVEVETAKRGTAKARYDLEQAKAIDNDAYHALLEAMGLNPTLKLSIASSEGRQLPRRLSDDVDMMIRKALTQRPDIAAALAELRAKEADVKVARADFFPTVGVQGAAFQNVGGLSVEGGPWSEVSKPGSGFLLQFKLPLFDGGMRIKNLRIAQSKEKAAKEQLFKTQDTAMREVARTCDALNSSLAQYEAAQAFVEAADKELESAVEAYRQGVGTFTVAETAETNHTQAKASLAQAYAGVLTTAATLAFTTGDLISSNVLEH